MKKTRILFILLALIFVTTVTVFAADNDVTVKIDAELVQFDVQPTIHNGRTMVPLRKIFEALGATVEWDDPTRTVTSTKGNTTIKVKIDSKTMTVNGKSVTLDVPAMIIGGRTLVPVRAISESFGCQVGWDGKSRMVSIIDDKANFTMLYAAGDRSRVIANKDVNSHLKVGWYRDAKLTDNEITYGTGEVWKVNGQWELSFDDAIVTVVNNGVQTVQVTWKYKNIGYTGELNIGYRDFDVFDQEMEVANSTFYDVDDKNYTGANCKNGIKATCVMGWELNNRSQKMKIYVEKKDSNGKIQSAWFEVKVVPKAQEPEKDKLEGCTFKVDNSLPKTISYYKYDYDLRKTVKQSSCSVTDISFEVSGDDLYIYFTGKKTYDYRGSGQSDSCVIGWKLYDSNNNVIASSSTSTLGIAVGEGFVKAKGYAWDCITPGGSYRLVIMDVN